MNKFEKASLLTIGGGGAINKFDHELNQAIDNCRDPNTDTNKARKVILEVTLVPDATRQNVAVEYVAKAKLAPDSKGQDQLILTRDKAFVNNAQQLLIDDYEKDVAKLEGREETGND
jgi:hypothetical protein